MFSLKRDSRATGTQVQVTSHSIEAGHKRLLILLSERCAQLGFKGNSSRVNNPFSRP